MVSLAALLLLLAPPPPPSPFDPPPPYVEGFPGTRGRMAETISRLAERLDRDPADLDALRRLYALNETLGRDRLMIDVARKALEQKGLDDKARAAVRGLLGRALYAQANESGELGAFMIVMVNGKIIQQGNDLTDEQKKQLTEAREHLREAVKHDSSTPELHDALADVIEALQGDPEKPNEEAMKLRVQAEVLRAKTTPSREIDRDALYARAMELLAEAQQLEQVEKDPDHVRALELRKQALVLAFGTDTIPFDFAATLYEPVSLLAPPDHVSNFLRRSFRQSDGEIGWVDCKYHGTPRKRQLELVAELGRDGSNGADAALVALVRGANSIDDPLAAAARDALRTGEHAAVRPGLPVLLAKALFADDWDRFPPAGQRLLVDLAIALECRESVPVLAASLERDVELAWPRGIARAIGRLGAKEQAPALLARAKDASLDVAFRREAARACARLDPEAAKALDAVPELAIALAAARYEAAPGDASKGRLLNGLGNERELHVAARYCAELRIMEAVPALEKFVETYGEKQDHVARLDVVRALAELNRAP